MGLLRAIAEGNYDERAKSFNQRILRNPQGSDTDSLGRPRCSGTQRLRDLRYVELERDVSEQQDPSRSGRGRIRSPLGKRPLWLLGFRHPAVRRSYTENIALRLRLIV